LFLFQASDVSGLQHRVKEVLASAGELSMAETADLASSLANELADDASKNAVRAACVASSPDELAANLKKLLECCDTVEQTIDPAQGVFFGKSLRNPRIGFLFPGQSCPFTLTAQSGRAASPEFAISTNVQSCPARRALPQRWRNPVWSRLRWQ